MNRKDKAVFVAKYGMLIALAFVLSFVETLAPVSMVAPGIKLGLANLVVIVGLYTIGIKGTIAVSIIRIVLVGFTFGNLFSMFYSLAGGALSLLCMILARKANCFSTVGVSIIGGVGHNIGQITIAAFVVQQAGVFYYLPYLLIAGTAAGMVIGVIGGMIVKRIQGVFK